MQLQSVPLPPHTHTGAGQRVSLHSHACNSSPERQLPAAPSPRRCLPAVWGHLPSPCMWRWLARLLLPWPRLFLSGALSLRNSLPAYVLCAGVTGRQADPSPSLPGVCAEPELLVSALSTASLLPAQAPLRTRAGLGRSRTYQPGSPDASFHIASSCHPDAPKL